MRIKNLLIFVAFQAWVGWFAPSLNAQSNLVEISGEIRDGERNEPLPGVSILIKGSTVGTITDVQGNFRIRTRIAFPFTLQIRSIGYKPLEMEVLNATDKIAVNLETESVLVNEVVVSASRVEENILQSPVSIDKLTVRTLQQSPAPGFYDALENVKGVQMTTSSLTFKVPNTRGFNAPNNFRFMQLVDGVDMQAATLGVPLGNAIGPTELDIESIEVTPGAASALYGMNAINGMANLQTKSPFLHQGLSLYQRTGVNHVDGVDYRPSVLTETAVRYARAFNNKLAFKVNFSYFQGMDWRGNTATDQNPNTTPSTANPSFPELNGVVDHPAYDAWNKYGDDGGSNAVTISGISYGGKTNQSLIVRRTGYWEKDLVPGKVTNLKFDGAVHYRLGSNAELSYAYRYGVMDGLFQRGNKIQLDNTTVQNHRLELKGANYFVRSYVSLEDTGDSYNLKPLSDNLDLTHLSNNAWGAKYKAALQQALNAGTSLAEAARLARAAADEGRVVPATREFEDLKQKIVKINNWDHINAGIVSGTATGGAALLQRSRLYHTDAQFDLSDRIKIFDLLVGGDFRTYAVIPDGNNFVDFSRPNSERTTPLPDGSFGRNVYYRKFGFFAQVTKALLQNRLKVFGSLRYDKNLEFKAKVNPRLAAVYTIDGIHNIRLTYQNGFRFPALFEALSFVNNGNIRRVGGLPYINEGLGYLDNSYTLASVQAFNAAVNADKGRPGNTLSDTELALKNRALLQVTSLSATRPEHINSFEAGYKSVLLNNRLVIDWDAYFNIYEGFLGQVEVSVPENNGVAVGTDAAVVAMLQANRAKQTRYRVYTNARQKYRNFGSSLGVTWNFYGKYTVSGNLNYNDISENKEKDVFVTGFNTPRFTSNVSLGNREVVRNIGFNVMWRWQREFLWESPLANGTIPGYHTIDAQVTVRVPALSATVKAGGSNLFNKRYIQYAAGPTIGGLYYLAITVDGLFRK